jgi:RNA polymerase sigma factor (sigma-70 family)
MTAIAIKEGVTQADTDLVAASRQGNREAFGQIVRRYQGLISGLIYSTCGDLSASEDIAQETFLAAWKSLSGLREPEKLPAWLCQIARHRMLDQNRETARENARLARAVTIYDRTDSPRPDEEAMTAEEREVLWCSLSQIAEPYRETLVLYYRQNQSGAEVAAALEISEETVRQRLSRGRQMLREQVAAMLERNLVRSAPSAAFSSAVVAALPSLMAQGATAAATGGMAKATTAAKGVALLPMLAIWIGPIIGVMGGIFGTARSIRATETPRERRLVVRISIIVWIFVLAAMAILFSLQYLGRRLHWGARGNVIAQCSFWLIYSIALVVMVRTWNRRHQTIRCEEGLPPVPASVAVISPRVRFISLTAATIGSLAWMLALALEVWDLPGAAVLCGVGLLLVAHAWQIREKLAANVRRLYLRHAMVLLGFTIIMLNWRLYFWFSGMTGMSAEHFHHLIPRGTLNLLLGVLSLVVLALTWVTTRPKEPNLR